MTEAEQATVRRVLDRYLEGTGGPLADVREAARLRKVLPILADWTGFVGLQEDGTMTWVETEESRFPVSPEPGPFAKYLARIRGADLFPELSFLRPIVGSDWLLCDGCRGTGRPLVNGQEAPQGFSCVCGGLGKVPPNFDDILKGTAG
jgi:hypothetical protein